MNEINKTTIFVAIAVLLSLITWLTTPKLRTLSPEDMIGKLLFEDFDDPLAATSLEIVKYDEATASSSTFKVAQLDGQWSIPSHSNYPADAENHLAEAATDLIRLKVLSVPVGAGQEEAEEDVDVQSQHEQYGVIDPAAKGLSGATGVGTRVTMRDKNDDVLLALIVGKKVPDRDGLRFVRRVGQDPVYTVSVETDKLSTKFEDWIEEDLLKLSAWDIRQIRIDDYSIDILQRLHIPRGQMVLQYDDTGDPKWKMTVDKVFKEKDWVDTKLGEDEELDTDKLNELKNAMDDLKIVDVSRKPEGFSANLRVEGKIYTDAETEQSLANRGFYVIPVKDPNDPQKQYYDLRSNEGEISVLMKDGVKYVLRFGQIAAGTASGSEDKEEKEGEEGEEESGGSNVNRYLFVMAQFDPSVIEKPELEPLPEEKEPAEGETKSEKTDAKEPKEKAEKAEGEEKKDEKTDSDKKAELEKERQRIEKENIRKQEEYDEKIKKGEEKVKELNPRFADWYYVISDEVYQKIHLGRDDVVKQKEKSEDEDKESKDDESKSEDADQEKVEKPKETSNPLREFEDLKEKGVKK